MKLSQLSLISAALIISHVVGVNSVFAQAVTTEIGDAKFVQFFTPPIGVPKGTLMALPIVEHRVPETMNIKVPGLGEKKYTLYYNVHMGNGPTEAMGRVFADYDKSEKTKYFYVAIWGDPRYSAIRKRVVHNELYAIGYHFLLAEAGVDTSNLENDPTKYSHNGYEFNALALAEYISNIGSVFAMSSMHKFSMKMRLDIDANKFESGESDIQQYRLSQYVYSTVCERSVKCYVNSAEGFVKVFSRICSTHVNAVAPEMVTSKSLTDT